MTFATDPKPVGGAATLVEHAISQLHSAQKLLRKLQEQFVPHGDKVVDAGAVWHALETIDDRLHDALGALGD